MLRKLFQLAVVGIQNSQYDQGVVVIPKYLIGKRRNPRINT